MAKLQDHFYSFHKKLQNCSIYGTIPACYVVASGQHAQFHDKKKNNLHIDLIQNAPWLINKHRLNVSS